MENTASVIEHILKNAYKAFNERNIDAVLSYMHPEVDWPNGWEGGYVKGHGEVKGYWKRQWKELDPQVTPVSVKQKEDGRFEVLVRQLVKDLNGNVLADGTVKHLYTIDQGLIKKMDIEQH